MSPFKREASNISSSCHSESLSSDVSVLVSMDFEVTVTVEEGALGSFSGQSVLGVVRVVKTPSKVPAHASLKVKKAGRLKIFLTVAGIDECSYCEVDVGPVAW